MINHTILINVNPRVFALTVVIGMAVVGLGLGVILDSVMTRFGLQIARKESF